MILDKLLERKDIIAYIDFRIKFLSSILESELLKVPVNDREFIRQRFIGRKEELKILRKLIAQDKIKKMSKKYFEELIK